MTTDNKNNWPSRDAPTTTPPAEELDQWPLSGPKNFRPAEIQQQQYDPRPQEDLARRNIAYWLIALLSGICFATFATLWFTRIPVEDVLKIVEILLGPIVALVSAATGFYYGTKSKN